MFPRIPELRARRHLVQPSVYQASKCFPNFYKEDTHKVPRVVMGMLSPTLLSPGVPLKLSVNTGHNRSRRPGGQGDREEGRDKRDLAILVIKKGRHEANGKYLQYHSLPGGGHELFKCCFFLTPGAGSLEP